jgi:hypothetical protein
MATINIRPGDSGTLTAAFLGNVKQDAWTPRNSGTLTVITRGCGFYLFDASDPQNLVELRKLLRDTTSSVALVAGHPYLVLVIGTTDAQPSGTVDWSFA